VEKSSIIYAFYNNLQRNAGVTQSFGACYLLLQFGAAKPAHYGEERKGAKKVEGLGQKTEGNFPFQAKISYALPEAKKLLACRTLRETRIPGNPTTASTKHPAR